MTSSHVVRTPTKTPIKIYFPRANDYCRFCNENVKINGYSQLNIFTEKNRDFLRRFRLFVNAKVENNSKISQVLCKKCYRAVLTHEKLLSQSEELQEFRNKYKEVNTDVGELTRRRRCAKDSPCKSSRTARTPSSPATKTFERVRNHKSKRKIISTTNDSAERDEEAVFVGQPRNASPTEVRIYYPSGLVKKIISAEIDASIVRQICSQEYNGVINVWRHPELKTEIIDKIHVEINKESSALCSTKDPSILRKTKASDLIAFSDSTCEEELKRKAPILYGCLYNVASDNTKKENERKKTRLAAPISLATFILVKERCPQMSAIAYRFALGVLWYSGAKKQGYVRANHWGISTSHTCILEKLDEMGSNFDEAVKTWKCELEKNHLINEALEQVAEYVDAKDKEQIPVGCQTTDLSCLSLTFPQTSTNDQNVLCSDDVDSQSTNSDLLDMEDFLNDYTECRESTKDLKSPENDVNCFLINNCGYSESVVDIFNNFVHSQGLEVSTLSKKMFRC